MVCDGNIVLRHIGVERRAERGDFDCALERVRGWAIVDERVNQAARRVNTLLNAL